MMTSQSVGGACSWQLRRLSSTDSTADNNSAAAHVQAVFVKNSRVQFHLGSHDDEPLHDDVITRDVTATI